MMNHEEAFLTDICKHPLDNAPRLIYADWLEEQGTPDCTARANFIRLQCRLAEIAEDEPSRTALQSEAGKLLKAYRKAWMQPLRAVLKLPDKDVTFARGFPSSVVLRRIEDLRHIDSLKSVAPLQ